MSAHISGKYVAQYTCNLARSFPTGIITMLLAALVWAVDLSVRPYLLKIILDRISVNTHANIFAYMAIPIVIYLFMFFLSTTIFRLYGYFVEIRMIPQMRKKIASQSIHSLLEQSQHYFQNHFSGSLTNKVNDLLNSIPDIIQIVIDRFLSHGLALVIAIYTLWQVNIKFAFLMFVWATLFIIGSLIFSKRLAHLADTWAEYSASAIGAMLDVLSNILSVRLFARKTEEKEVFSSTINKTVKAEQKLQWSYFWVWFCYGYSFVFIQGLNLYFLLIGKQEGWITVGDFALVLTINIAIIDFLWQLTKDFSQFSKLLGRITQALRTFSHIPDIQDNPNAKNLYVYKGEIIFHQVKFQYNRTQRLFQNKSVIIAAGQKVGLVGYSGSGKTTFVNLILRLFDVNDGYIAIDGQKICEVTQESLRSAIGMIPQDLSLFHRNLMENIRYGRTDATDEEVIAAAKEAHAHEFILQQPDQYESLVGEHGVKLSSGQRQRIAIARAILKNAPILILDEATSQLDSLTENDIQESLWKLMQGKTTIVIAHRLSTLLNMDRILVFDKGKIVEDGTHSQLLANEGIYTTLWHTQVGGFLPNKKTNEALGFA